MCHAWAEENEEGQMVLSVLPHDLEEFNAIVERHGTAWRTNLAEFVKSVNKAQVAFDYQSDDAYTAHKASA